MVERTCVTLGLKVLVHRLSLQHSNENLENASRNARYRTLSDWAKELGAQTVLLAHHADDQAETVLKRVLEGADITSLGAMRPVSTMDTGVVLWRPLLNVTKREVLSYLDELRKTRLLCMEPLNDPSNLDVKFTRARMRETILPDLTQAFGKEVSTNLSLLADASSDLKDYMHHILLPYLELAAGDSSSMQILLDLADLAPLHPFEAKQLVRILSQKMGLTPSRGVVANIARILLDKPSIAKVVYMGQGLCCTIHRTLLVIKPVDT
mmetsp:Transcript_37194/g.60223  ORF Transcript_37194/g.60223 Transcript_37194/m.60223 type:complete len:266 (-) Transcript_37194:33-830(-)